MVASKLVSSHSIVRYAEVIPTPWKNGLGVTAQLAVAPPRATHESFDWRISIARLDKTAPFSVFVGVERCLAILEGEVVLMREGMEPLVMNDDSAPVRFSGETAATGQVTRGPALDLNVMCRAGKWTADMRRSVLTRDVVLTLSRETFICSRCNALHIELAGERIALGQYDMLRVDEACEARIVVQNPIRADFYIIELRCLVLAS